MTVANFALPRTALIRAVRPRVATSPRLRLPIRRDLRHPDRIRPPNPLFLDGTIGATCCVMSTIEVRTVARLRRGRLRRSGPPGIGVMRRHACCSSQSYGCGSGATARPVVLSRRPRAAQAMLWAAGDGGPAPWQVKQSQISVPAPGAHEGASRIRFRKGPRWLRVPKVSAQRNGVARNRVEGEADRSRKGRGTRWRAMYW